MTYDSEIRRRRSLRLRGYDYSQAGAYCVTICTQDRKCLFGDIVNGEMGLNDAGKIVADQWIQTAAVCEGIELDEWGVMPNHFHGILVITDPVEAIRESPLRMTVARRRNMLLPKLIGRFKMLSSKRINQLRDTAGAKLWQRNYWEHVIRNEQELNRIRMYIRNNPAQWEMDKLYQGQFVNGSCDPDKQGDS